MANKSAGGAAQEITELCRIDSLLNRWSHQLSGGEKQRVALALQLLAAPKLLLLDEPYSNLDFTHKNILMAVIDDIATKTAITCVLVSHDPSDTLSWAHRILVLRGGTVLQHATPKEIYYQPASSYVASLFGKYNLLTPEMARQFAHYGGSQQPLVPSIIRPSQLLLQPKGEGVEGAIVDVRFLGAYAELVVQIDDQYFVVNTLEDFKVGDAIHLAVKPFN
jgi:iron(III) transport system ATP-binding protein